MTDTSQEHTAAYKIFHYYFECMLPASFAFQNKNQLMGTLVYESPEKEDTASKEMIPRQHTVAEMIEYHRRGATIILRDPQDAVKIYGWLRDHLSALRQRVQFGVNAGHLPMEDLQDMDDFASMVYRIARNYEQVDERQGQMGRKLEGMFARRAIKRKRVEETEHSNEQEPEERPVKEHNSIVSDISHTAIERGLNFK